MRWEGGGMRIRAETNALHDDRLRRITLRRLCRALRHLGLWPLKTLLLPEGSSSHYAGSIPIDSAGPLHATASGEIFGFPSVYCADAALFPCLPSGPHTLTIMANARRIAHSLARRMQTQSHALE